MSDALTKVNVIHLLRRVVGPDVYSCEDCGPFAGSDEDGCCTTCGADLKLLPFHIALDRYEERYVAKIKKEAVLHYLKFAINLMRESSWNWAQVIACMKTASTFLKQV